MIDRLDETDGQKVAVILLQKNETIFSLIFLLLVRSLLLVSFAIWI